MSVVALIQLAESGKTRSSHPDLKSLPILQVRRGSVLGVSIREALLPVGRRDDVVVAILSLSVKVLVTVPRNARVVAHTVLPCLVASTARGVCEHRAGESVVEHGVGDETTRVVGLVSLAIKRSTVGIADVADRSLFALELIRIERENVSAMVLVEVGEVVVEEDWGTHLLRDGKLQVASRVVSFDAVVERGADVRLPRPLSIHGTVRTLECSANGAARHSCKVTSTAAHIWSIDNTVGVIKSNLLNLGLRIRMELAVLDWCFKEIVPERSRTTTGHRWERI